MEKPKEKLDWKVLALATSAIADDKRKGKSPSKRGKVYNLKSSIEDAND